MRPVRQAPIEAPPYLHDKERLREHHSWLIYNSAGGSFLRAGPWIHHDPRAA